MLLPLRRVRLTKPITLAIAGTLALGIAPVPTAASVAATGRTQSSPIPARAATAVVPAGAEIPIGTLLTSPNGQFRLAFQPDGHLVMYDGSRPTHVSGVVDASLRLVLQGDGNLVLYRGATALAHTGTAGHAGAYLQVQDDGNLVIYNGAHQPVWALRGVAGSRQFLQALPPPPPPIPSGPAIVRAGTEIPPGTVVASPNGRFRLAFQGDGHLVLYDGATPTHGTGMIGADLRLFLQGDGNLVLYRGGAPAAHTHTAGRGGAFLQMQDDGNVVIYTATRQPVWALSFAGGGPLLRDLRGPRYQTPAGLRDIQYGGVAPFGGCGFNLTAGMNGLKVQWVADRLGVRQPYQSVSPLLMDRVAAFQRGAGLPANGVVDHRTWTALGFSSDSWTALDCYKHELRVHPGMTRAEIVENFVATAMAYNGARYVWGGANHPSHGADCSGLVIQALYSVGIDPNPNNTVNHALPAWRTSRNLAELPGLLRVPLGQRQRGDIVFYAIGSPTINHTAIYLGNGLIMETTGTHGRVSSLFAYSGLVGHVVRPIP